MEADRVGQAWLKVVVSTGQDLPNRAVVAIFCLRITILGVLDSIASSSSSFSRWRFIVEFSISKVEIFF